MRLTTLCYIEQNGCYLMMLRNKKENDQSEGKWIGVGGKLEPGEGRDECVVREVFEETGLTLTSYRYRGVVHFRSDIWEDEEMYLYTADGFAGELNTNCDEGELAWIPIDEVLDLNLWQGDKYFLEELTAGNDNIEMTLNYVGEEVTYSD